MRPATERLARPTAVAPGLRIMKVLIVRNTGLTGHEFARLVFRWGTRGQYECRESLHMPSNEYFLAQFFGFSAHVCYVDEGNPDCTDYYFFVWGPDGQSEPIEDTFMHRAQAFLSGEGHRVEWGDLGGIALH